MTTAARSALSVAVALDDAAAAAVRSRVGRAAFLELAAVLYDRAVEHEKHIREYGCPPWVVPGETEEYDDGDR